MYICKQRNSYSHLRKSVHFCIILQNLKECVHRRNVIKNSLRGAEIETPSDGSARKWVLREEH
jgi:predicted nucleic acid binding AN1-type Zn finger protein